MRRNRVSSVFRPLIGTLLMGASGAIAQPGTDALKLPVPRTFDLTHVEPAHYAVALGKDPVKIFEFVRDQIGYEAYTGALRGPRGTLLAMAGNSVDRAALLASLLKESGQRVQFVRGTLPKAEATKLVDSMWAEHLRPTPPEVAEPPAVKAALDTLVAGAKRDYTLIREHLKKANVTPSPASAPSLDSLVQEAQEHYWLQWWKDGGWVDLDPSFADATPGRAYTPAAGSPLDALPDALFHRVVVRMRLEEYTADQPSSREILTYTAKAAELSGVDVVLSHQPENWTRPAASLASALASAIGNTGRVKPVMIIGAQPVMGEAFRQTAPTAAGIGSITDLLGGAGTRKPVPIATAETIEFDFIFPGGRKETVVREIFDVVGKARRVAGRNLSADEVRNRTEAANAVASTQGVYDLFFNTGRVDPRHLSNVPKGPAPVPESASAIDTFLRRVNITLSVASDALATRFHRPDRATILFYPDSPRIQIAELSTVADTPRISVDLRRAHTRAAAKGGHPGDVFFARILRGVIEGTLERVLMEYLTVNAAEAWWRPVISTSSVFERLKADGSPSVLLAGDAAGLGPGVPDDTRARVREELTAGFLVVAPEREVVLGKGPRLAWWRIDPRSGETAAVTDEGLHQTAVCYTQRTDQESGETTVVTRYVRDGKEFDYVRTFRIDETTEYTNFISSVERSAVEFPWEQFPWSF